MSNLHYNTCMYVMHFKAPERAGQNAGYGYKLHVDVQMFILMGPINN